MELELKEYFRIIRKRIWLIAAFVAIVALVTGVVSIYFLNPVYSASTKIIVNKANDSTIGTPMDLSTVNLNIRLINTYKEIIKTTGIMDKVAEKYPDFGLSAEQLIKKIKVSSVNDTQVMTLTVEDRSYDQAVQMVNAITEVFREEIPQIMKVDNVTVLSPAKVSEHPAPIKPNSKLNIAIAIVVSLVFVLGVVFLLEYLDDSIKNEKDIEAYLAVPVLATISKVKSDEIRQAPPQAPAEQLPQRKVGESNVSVNQ